MIVFSSDNGPVLNDGYYDEADTKNSEHTPWGSFRGGKYSLFEAGTHLPFITYWKGKIQPGVSDALVCQVDLLSSIASLVGSEIRTQDSEDLSDVFLGKSQKGREELVLEATSRTAFRKGDWVMIPPYKGPAINKSVNIELANADVYQLYNLKDDLSEQNNLAESNAEKLAEMIVAFEAIRGSDYGKIQQLELK
jgi:arylsulfatase A-like enzyme